MWFYRWNLTSTSQLWTSLASSQATSKDFVTWQWFIIFHLHLMTSQYLWDLGSQLQTLESLSEHPLQVVCLLNNLCLLKCLSNSHYWAVSAMDTSTWPLKDPLLLFLESYRSVASNLKYLSLTQPLMQLTPIHSMYSRILWFSIRHFWYLWDLKHVPLFP